MNFTSSAFAFAGLAAAAGPILIHLLNRRRYRVVRWAAMDFLREALRRNRRIMQFRDLLLLLLRVAAVILFGLALARPYYTSSKVEYDAGAPLHAILVLDNSLSMGYEYEALGETPLDRAKDRARQFVEELPLGSAISVVPLCGGTKPISVDPYRTKEDAIEAIRRVELVDRAGSLLLAGTKAEAASEAAPQLARRVVFFSDQQKENWRGVEGAKPLAGVPAMQVVDVGPRRVDNAWVADLRLQDGVADFDTPATFVVTVRRQGAVGQKELRVALEVGGKLSGAQSITLGEGDAARELVFQHQFTREDVIERSFGLAEGYGDTPSRPVFVPVMASIPRDGLPHDDERTLMAPVVAALPIVFIDQVSETEEDPLRNVYGQTYELRKLLAPRVEKEHGEDAFGEEGKSYAPSLIRVDHLALSEVSREQLRNRLKPARLVVVAGVRDITEEIAKLLEEYALQGGQLVIAAGGAFDPAAWNAAAWHDGAGVLPLKLVEQPVGTTPAESSGPATEWFSLNYESMRNHRYFQLAGNSEAQLRDLYAAPVFFKAIAVENSDDAVIGRSEKEIEAWANDHVASAMPATLARFDNDVAWMVERRLGKGCVLWVSSGVFAGRDGDFTGWNTLPFTYTMAVFDRIFREMIETTLPKRNFSPAERLLLPLEGAADAEFTLRRPAEEDAAEPVFPEGAAAPVLLIPNALTRGFYEIEAYRPDETGEERTRQWAAALAVNGPGEESDLSFLTRDEFNERSLSDNIRWVGEGEAISLAGAQVRGQDGWRYLIAAVLIALLVEMALLASSAWQAQAEVGSRR